MRAIHAEDIRAPAVAGMFYPEDAAELRRTVEMLLQQAEIKTTAKSVVATVAPHAGYIYSGPVAAHTFKMLQSCYPPSAEEKFRSPTVVVIAPSHREAFPFVSVFTGRAYRTPLGDVPVARDFAEALVASDQHFVAAWEGHRGEHALEVELPFLQVIWPEFRLVPVVMGYQDWELCKRLGENLARLASASPVFIVASSDLSHYYPYNQAVKIDERFIKQLQAFTPEALHQALENGICEACGGGPIVAAMIAAKNLGADTVEVLRYQNSGDVSGDRSGVVGYVSAVFEA
ncbi:MAG: AmmeMemoRadiSam system protein B [candidate division KSB1 bacterium]|nr:AmmeMemoRadiSam system protein B [candidate division KSB1 bacterium]MDZ7300861.1 AmmeMemoRadiSam system protein B [candidate division KSB1 bacterium]MDZ7309869.1 AmmeMemoRadiSam system protein B [candidate division KSB1 bacterium]